MLTDTSDLNVNNGELPLFFPTSPKNCPVVTKSASQIATSSHLSSKVSHCWSEINGDVSFNDDESAGWPLGSQGIAASASCFRFELDSKDGERLQALLEEDALSSRETNTGKIADSRSLAETPGRSFRSARNGTEELNRDRYGHLKPPRQLEKLHSSTRFVALLNAFANEIQGCDAQLRDSPSMWQVEARNTSLTVPPSPGRSEILRRLSDLKAHPLSPRLAPEDAVNYDKEKAKTREDLHHRQGTRLPLSSNDSSKSSSTSVSKEYPVLTQSQCKLSGNALGGIEIMPNLGEKSRQGNSPSKLRGSPHRSAQSSQEHLTTPISRLKNSSIQEQIVIICKQPQTLKASNVSDSSPDHAPIMLAAVPFKWEEEPGRPKTIAAVANLAPARRATREGIEVGNFSETQSKSDVKPFAEVVENSITCKGIDQARSSSVRSSPETGKGDVGRTSSYRYYGQPRLRGHSRDASLGRSSRRYSIRERNAHIDLDGSAAAKFLVEAFESPSSTPSVHGGSPTFAVPFKWEDIPGKPKAETVARSPNMLQLPPRLAVPTYRSADSFSRELRVSHPFASFFGPCMQASSPAHRKQSDRASVQHASSRSLPPRVPGSPDRRKRHSFVGRCSSTPQEGCQIRVSKSLTSTYCNSEKSLVESLSTTSSPVLKPRSLCSSEMKNSPSWVQKNHIHAPSSPTSILSGPDGSRSQTSASNINLSSGDIEDFTRRVNHSEHMASITSSSASYESIQEDFPELPSPLNSRFLPPPSTDFQQSGEPQITSIPALSPAAADISARDYYAHRSKGNSDNDRFFEPSKTGKSLSKTKSQHRLVTTRNSEASLINYFQRLELSEALTTTKTKTSLSALGEETGLLDKHGAPTSSGYLNSKGEPISSNVLPTTQSVAKQKEASSTQTSPKRPIRLPHTMYTATEQFLASCSSSVRRQLIQDLSPRILRQYSGRRRSASYSGDYTSAHLSFRSNREEEVSISPAYAASLELLSPAASLMAQPRKGLGTPRNALTKAHSKPRRRARFVLSIYRTLRRVLCRQRFHKPIQPPKLTLSEGRSPTPYHIKTTYI